MTAPLAYGQIFEDSYLLRIFGAQTPGYYIDIGAWHPVKYSVSYPFYLSGWKGICVEPLEHYAKLADWLRPRDLNLRCLVGEHSGEQELLVSEGLDGLSTTISEYGPLAEKYGGHIRRRRVQTRTLSEICATYGVSEIDFLKIDVEGAELAVIRGADWSRWRPKVLIIEATVPGTDVPAWADWQPILEGAGYNFAGFDSLNRYFIAEEQAALWGRLDIDRKPWDEARYLYNLGSPFTNPGHPDHVPSIALGEVLLANVAAAPDEAAKVIVSDIVAAAGRDLADQAAISALRARLSFLPPPWPEADSNEALSAYCARLLADERLRPTLGRLSTHLAN